MSIEIIPGQNLNEQNVKHETPLESSIIMRLYGIDPDSKGIIYRTRAPLKADAMGQYIYGPLQIQQEEDQLILFDQDERIGTMFCPADDLFEEALKNFPLSDKKREEVVDLVSEYSKWLPVLEASTEPTIERVDFYNSRLVLAGRVFTALHLEKLFNIKTLITSSVFSNISTAISNAEQKLTYTIESFCKNNPEFLEYFGVHEDYFHNFIHAQLVIPTLVTNRHINPLDDTNTKEILQNVAKQDIGILTAFMMHRTTRFLVDEVDISAESDAEMSQIIATAEIPPEELMVLDNSRRSAYANMFGVYQDFAFKTAYPNIYKLADDAFLKGAPPNGISLSCFLPFKNYAATNRYGIFFTF
jgi:hypothetical protein